MFPTATTATCCLLPATTSSLMVRSKCFLLRLCVCVCAWAVFTHSMQVRKGTHCTKEEEEEPGAVKAFPKNNYTTKCGRITITMDARSRMHNKRKYCCSSRKVLDQKEAGRSVLDVALRPELQIEHWVEVHGHARHRIDLSSLQLFPIQKSASTLALAPIRGATMKGPAPRRTEAKALAPMAKAACESAKAYAGLGNPKAGGSFMAWLLHGASSSSCPAWRSTDGALNSAVALPVVLSSVTEPEMSNPTSAPISTVPVRTPLTSSWATI